MHFHVLGLGPIGSLVSHHLCKTLDITKHGVVLIHKTTNQLKKANLAGNTLKVEREGVVDSSTAFRSEVFEAGKQLRYEMREENRLVRDTHTSKKANAGGLDAKAEDTSRTHIQHTLLPIDSLIVTVKAYAAVDSVKALVPRLSPNSTVVLLHNGMGVYERLVDKVFRNPEQRPHFIVAVNDHGAWNKDYFHTVHAGVGAITFGLVADPRGRTFESTVADTDVPSQEQLQSLDNIMSPQEGDKSPYRSLRNTVAALSGLSGLNAIWKPISHVETAMKRKLVVNSAVNPLTALLGCRNGELLESAEAGKLINRICSEAAGAFAMQAQEERSCGDKDKQVRIQTGLSRVPPGLTARALEEECLRVLKITAGNISSMLSDVQSGSHTEIDYMNGYLTGLGRSFGLPMTTTTTLLNLIKLRTAIPLDHLVYK
ncbi:ketopantoate reductase PanE/ApbA C terminal-domain-containing protein [Russula ochroleuca]|jgi:2-dehydropantoate 2-reductase|uniref:2-dehydropantoate 2-reductase n=1 Tax=Russula ochroleuca TaxID=152965 RepID=A0A9P5T8W1_9AGAM|nr:ketopantoate reductase PanE/ApbA C terminal-domain-containing protein [Russula ochroleuca]